ncbi:hypothetical protein T484DRAFT_1785430 [Baffinella frigidus]|nr:hypothetical protein T484DRAFT_1785430 [Cryptophyta sp. CCMP2293]
MPVLLPGENRMTFDTFMHRNRGGDYAVARNRPDDQFNAQLQQAMLLSQQEGNVDAERLNRLKDRLAKYTELELQDVDSSGHCQFDAIAHQDVDSSGHCQFDAIAHQDVDSSGHCQFDELISVFMKFIAHQIFGRFAKEYPGGSGYNYRKVRNDLADWLLRNKHFNIDDTGTTITDFLDHERNKHLNIDDTGTTITDFLDHEDGDTWELFVDNIRDSQATCFPSMP